MSPNTKREGIIAAEHARAELHETLGLLSDRLNYAQRFDDAVAEKREKLSRAQKRNPVAFAVGVATVAAAAGAAAWAISASILRRFE